MAPILSALGRTSSSSLMSQSITPKLEKEKDEKRALQLTSPIGKERHRSKSKQITGKHGLLV